MDASVYLFFIWLVATGGVIGSIVIIFQGFENQTIFNGTRSEFKTLSILSVVGFVLLTYFLFY